ncbi:MAG: hypothetical protein H5T69_15770, partial [Chloroflexi bacterium]|nr:hypothetical protein [Chloroflexota bacterium]
MDPVSQVPPSAFLLVFLSATLASALLTPLAIRLGQHWGLVAVPGGRRKHTGRVVRIGGLGLFPAFALGALLPVWLGLPRQDPLELTRLIGVLLGMGLVWIVGLLDDAYDLPAWGQLLGLLAASAIAIGYRVF